MALFDTLPEAKGDMQREDSGAENENTGANIMLWIFRLAVPALIAYFTAQGTIDRRVTTVETNEAAHYEEMKRAQSDSAADIKSDIRELRAEIRELMKDKGR